MKRPIAAFACSLAMLISTCAPTTAGFKDSRLSSMNRSAPRRAETIPVPPLLTRAPLLAEEPLLTTIAKKITASPDFSGAVIPGQLLNVRLILPRELGGTARHTGPPRRPAPRRPAPRGATPRGALNRRAQPPPGRAVGRTVAPAVAAGMTPLDDIPCQLLPGGCPPPVTTEPGVQISNFALHVKWGVIQSVNGSRGAALAENQDFQSPTSSGVSRAFVLAPLHVAEYTGATPPTKPYLIVATVTITADKIVALPPSTIPVTSAEVPVEVPLSLSALEVPKVFVLFLDKNFGGAAAIYLPASTVFKGSSSQVQEQLFSGAGRLLDTYNTVASRLNFVTWFGSYLAGLEALRKVRDVPHVDVKERKNSESNLNDDDFIHRSPFTNLNDTEVEDESSALLLLGPPGTQVKFFQDGGFRGGEFDVQTSNPRDHRTKPPTDYAPGILISNFDAVTTSVPPGKVMVVKKFTDGGEVKPNDRVSSFKWGT